MRIKTIWVKNVLIRWFIRNFPINLDEAESSRLEDYHDFNQFFTRALKPGARILHKNPQVLLSPVDGYVSQIGSLAARPTVQAKGHDYTLEALLSNKELAQVFQDGDIATLYLAPHHYHRVHMPMTGKLRSMHYVPGTLFSVNANSVKTVPGLFAKNERVITVFDTAAGPMALVLVGAFLVASIETIWEGVVAPQTTKRHSIKHWDYSHQAITIEQGEEMGRFLYGSTVIVVFPKHTLKWTTDLAINSTIQLGQSLGSLLHSADE